MRGLGPAYTRSLLEAFGGPSKVFHATREELAHAIKLPSRTLDSLENSKERLSRYQDVAERQSRLAEAMDVRILTLNDPKYPRFLRDQHKQAPALLHVQGDLSLVRARAVAVVGTRSPSTEAVERVRAFSTRLCESDSPVVAGMAKGVDAAAHSGALDSSGTTIGVLGCGLDRIYPPENAPLYAETRKRGLLISQFPFGSAPSPGNLRQRNKLIVALSQAVVIAESDVQGGAMIAARAAVEQEREPLRSPMARYGRGYTCGHSTSAGVPTWHVPQTKPEAIRYSTSLSLERQELLRPRHGRQHSPSSRRDGADAMPALVAPAAQLNRSGRSGKGASSVAGSAVAERA